MPVMDLKFTLLITKSGRGRKKRKWTKRKEEEIEKEGGGRGRRRKRRRRLKSHGSFEPQSDSMSQVLPQPISQVRTLRGWSLADEPSLVA